MQDQKYMQMAFDVIEIRAFITVLFESPVVFFYNP